MEFNLQNLLSLVTILGAGFAIWKDYQRDRRDKAEAKLQEQQVLRADLKEDYERVKSERDELLKQRDELFQQNRPSIELTKCIAEQEMLIESLRKDLLEVQTDRDFWIEFANKHWSQKVVRDYTEGRTY